MGDDVRQGPVLLFDGTCNFCDGAVHFILDHERAPELRFAALQSEAGERLLARVLGDEEAKALRNGADGSGDPDSLVLVDGDRAYTHSSGALRVARYLRAPWSWGAALKLVPRALRDVFYRWFARNRYRWFGKSDACRVPTAELRARFL